MSAPTMQVGDLVSALRQRSRVITARMGDVELVIDEDGANYLRVGENRLPWGANNTKTVINALKGPQYKYVRDSPLPWQRTLVAHHTEMFADNLFTWYVEGSNISGIYQEGEKVLPLVGAAEVLNDVFDYRDPVSVVYGSDQVEINVTSNFWTVTVPGIPDDPTRPMDGMVEWGDIMVGDMSGGGVRIILYPGKAERAPIVEEFWLRKMCENGMTRRIAGSQINLRGRTVEEIFQEMKNVVILIVAGLAESGQKILHSAQTPIPGAVSDYIRQVGSERGINSRAIVELQKRGTSLRENPSIYDVTQLFTALANEEGLPVLTRRNLQALGGDLLDHDHATNRCSRCERPYQVAA